MRVTYSSSMGTLQSCARTAWMFAIILTHVISVCLCFNLDGSPGSYAKFPIWEPCSNGSISFEFKTDRPNALLFYFDSGQRSFLELKLVGGIARLRMNFGKGTINLSAGQNLDDRQWHKLEIIRKHEHTTLTVDTIENTRTSIGKDFELDSHTNSSRFLFIGGLSEEYDRELSKLALPSVVFEPKFRGSVRNLFYSNCGSVPERPEMLDSQGLLSSATDLCEKGNPCMNSGSCLTTDNGLICECTRTEFTGDRCQIEKVPSDATFLGAQYFSYDLSSRGDPIISNSDELFLDFRTKQLNGLLFYTGDLKDYLNVAVKEGGIKLTINLGSGAYETEVKPSHVRFDDNRWHHLVIKREAREISIEVDGVHRRSGSTTGTFTQLSSSVLYVGGSPNTGQLAGTSVFQNFKGCMRKVKYKADNIELDLTELAKTEHSLISVFGDVIFNKCQELVESHPITFTTPESFITLPTWDVSHRRGSLSFQFQTSELNGVLMYNSGPDDYKDFFGIEILDGHLYLVLDLGSGVQKVKASKHQVSDGNPHEVYVDYQGQQGYITLDGIKASYYSDGNSDFLELSGFLFVGGINDKLDPNTLPQEMWAGMLGHGYVGCFQDLVINGKKVDLVVAANGQVAKGIAEYCHRIEPQCLSHPCMHHGICLEGWNRFVCDCRATGYIGHVCQKAATTLRFDGTQFVKVRMPEESSTEAEDISLRFRTMHPNGLLFLTSSEHSTDSMELYLESSAIKLSINVGSGAQILTVGNILNDDRWHTVFIRRRAQTIEIGIDKHRPVTDKLPGQETSLQSNAILLGSLDGLTPADMPGVSDELEFRNIEIGHMLNDDNSLGKHSGFIGSMQQFMFNQNLFFEMAKSGKIDNIQVTAKFSTDEYVVRDPITFKSASAFAMLNRLQVYKDFSLSFQFKTTEADGLMFYNAGRGQDFFAIELKDGFLYYIYNMGDGPQQIKTNTREALNNNKWHEVRLLRTELYKQLIRIDDNTPTIDNLSGAQAVNFDLEGNFFVGGVRKTMYHSLPKQIQSKYGFLGCLGSLDLNGYLPQVVKDADTIHQSVVEGCKGPTRQCQKDSCANLGRCIQQWNSYSCDCDMTSYSGATCKSASTTFEFGPGIGLMTFTHPSGKRPDNIRDTLALGFTTRARDAVLVRINSGSYDDYIELEVVNGNVFVVYNMGTTDHPIGELFEKVNDGKYHVVRFTRSGANSTIQVDGSTMQTKNPKGQQLEVFNNQANIYIGGKHMDNGSIVRPFQGTISGLVLNGFHILDLAVQKDPRVTIRGNVFHREDALIEKPARKEDKFVYEMQSTMGVRQRTQPVPSRHSKRHTRHRKEENTIRRKRRRGYVNFNTWNNERNKIATLIHYDDKENKNIRPLLLDERILMFPAEGEKQKNTSESQLRLDWLEKQKNEINRWKKVKDTFVNKDVKDAFVNKVVRDAPTSTPANPLTTKTHYCSFQVGKEEFFRLKAPVFDLIKEGSADGKNFDDDDEDDDEFSQMKSTIQNVDDVTSEKSTVPSRDQLTRSKSTVPSTTDVYFTHRVTNTSIVPTFWSNHQPTVHRHRVTIATANLPSTSHLKITVATTISSFMQTTPKLGVTDDIIFSGAGPGCHSDDEDDCSPVGSGTEDDIITPRVIIKTTPTPPTTTPKSRTYNKCTGSNCPINGEEYLFSTSDKVLSEGSRDYNTGPGGSKPTPETSKEQTGKGSNPINIGIIIGIAAGVLVAILILVFALYKFRSRDEGTYKVDESQNFSYLESKKQQGNGALLTTTDSANNPKRTGKKKDVKEWYV